eukprot:CAMPEP_0206536238 /NCGR_PEP_ID=MMETSP0325_2-20121206/6635_1 /ASSEMBLY_ACC=CAM_ASM_000347 /TAXON_ID=2866 /ORGANISM="Crypthecodinium cohnii, Strain Seligo" /LENGTH=650 /DNA_ID=CAMNT_0054033421 /DNA_START=21 /DNA_END=1970 /DNA_ORIENTATION=-
MDRGRLRELSPAEEAHYAHIFASHGADPRVVGATLPGAVAAEVLSTSGLPRETLGQIWYLSVDSAVDVDFPSFCAACRLCAHAQQAGDQQMVQEAWLHIPPNAPPKFETTVDLPPREPPGGAYNAPAAGYDHYDAAFDFEASALGFDSSSKSRPTRAPDLAGQDNLSAPFALGPNFSRRGLGKSFQEDPLDDFDGGNDIDGGGDPDDIADTIPSIESSVKVAVALGLDTSDFSNPCPVAKTPLDRTAREYLERRQELDKRLTRTARTAARIASSRQRLEELREARRATAEEVACREADIKSLFESLSYTRTRLSELESEVNTLRTARASYPQKELDNLMRRFGRLGPTASEQATSQARIAKEAAFADTRGSDSMQDEVARLLRQRTDLQAKQQLLLAGQRQAGLDRTDARQALEEERLALQKVQRQRLQAAEDRMKAVEDLFSLAKEMNLGKDVVRELLGYGQATKPTQVVLDKDAFETFAKKRERLRRGIPAASNSLKDLGDLGEAASSFDGGRTETIRSASPERPPGDEVDGATWWRSRLGAAGGVVSRGLAEAARQAATLGPRPHPNFWTSFPQGSPAANSDSEHPRVPLTEAHGRPDPTLGTPAPVSINAAKPTPFLAAGPNVQNIWDQSPIEKDDSSVSSRKKRW